MKLSQTLTASLFTVFLFGGLHLHSFGQKQTEAIKAVMIRSRFPYLQDNCLMFFVDSVVLVETKDISLYITYHQRYVQHIQLDAHFRYIGEKDTMKIEPHYFIHHKNDVYGCRSNELSQVHGKQWKVDSFLKNYAIGGFQFDEDFYAEHVLTDSTVTDNELTLKYVRSIRKIPEADDTAYMYYRLEALGLNFTLSTRPDIIGNKKLWKLRTIHNTRFDKTSSLQIPAQDYLITIEPAFIRNREEIFGYIDKYRHNKQ